MSNLGKWEYGDGEACYGNELVYQKARDFLGDSCEDWGCGTAWARRYFTHYRGVDGSRSPFVDEIRDLTEYTSDADNILLRQVLEHDFAWRKILGNARGSFRKKLCITLHTPMVGATHVLEMSPNDVPNIAFRLQDILGYFKDCKVTTEEVPTGRFDYGIETIICVERQ